MEREEFLIKPKDMLHSIIKRALEPLKDLVQRTKAFYNFQWDKQTTKVKITMTLCLVPRRIKESLFQITFFLQKMFHPNFLRKDISPVDQAASFQWEMDATVKP